MKKKIQYQCSKCGEITEKDRKIDKPICYNCKKERRNLASKKNNNK